MKSELLHLPMESKVSVGERIVTSGDGNYFPEGIAVGVVTAVRENHVEVTPMVDWSRLEYVTVAGVHQGLMEKPQQTTTFTLPAASEPVK